MSFRERDGAQQFAPLRLANAGHAARKLGWLLLAAAAVACSFPERSFIPADEFDRLKDSGSNGGSAASGGSTGGTGAAAGGVGGSSGSGAAGSGGTGATAGSAGAGGTTTGGNGGNGGSAGAGGGAGGSAGAAGGTGGSSGTAGNSSGGTGGGSGGAGGTGGTAGNTTGGTGGGSGATVGVIFSEYVEGTNFNKALEVFNGSAAHVDLSTCVLNKYVNAETTPTPLALTSFDLAPNKTWVICNTQIADASKCDRTDAFVSHNGNEAYSLVCSGVVEDTFGQTGAGSPPRWGSGTTSSEDHTLRRKCSVTQGDTDLSDAFDPVNQWDGFPKDDFTGLGAHCGH